jgi:iron uptake system component EfeO
MSTPIRRLAPLAALGALVTLAACSTATADVQVDVTGTDDACTLSADVLDAGNIGFEFTNKAGDVNELYVLKANGDVVGEVENVTTGTSRTLIVDLVAGDYLVRCKPGQTGDGIESAFTVKGEGGTAEAIPDRTVTFEAVEFRYPDLVVDDITAGETIRFEMANKGSQAHEFEVLDPDGNAIGEVASTEPGGVSGATITFESPGVYTYQCILVDENTGKQHTELDMTGTFEVAEA